MSNDISTSGEPTDTELRELVYQSLERDGLIMRLKAQLRAAVFKTIEKSSNSIENDFNQTKTADHSDELCRAIVLDWIEQSNLLYTQDLFKIETSNSSPILTRVDLINEFHFNNQIKPTQSILHRLIESNRLPHSIKQSIDSKFVNEKISDLNRLREHFRSLFSHAFDVSILDYFLNKHLPSSTSSINKSDYEQICLKWFQSCSKVLNPSSLSTNGHVKVTQARRSFSPPSDSVSSSSSTSQSDHPRKTAFDFVLPTIVDSKSNSTSFNHHVKTIEDITNGHKNLPIEYDDESVSQSQMSSIDDVTVDKASPSVPMDFSEDLE